MTMAVLTEADRVFCRTQFAEQLSAEFESLGLIKSEVRAAIDATDSWINDNKASFNTALPEPARSTMNASQKARLFNLVSLRRFVKDV